MSTIKPSSWAERVRVSDSNSRCTLEKLSRQPPGTILQIPNDMQLADAEDWKRSMIGFFVSYKLPFYAVQSIANRIWKPHGLEKTIVLSNGFMVFRFSSVAQMEEVLARGPWMFGGKTILLQQWKPGFKFDRNKIKSIPRRPLADDEATLKGSRVEYARVCIEIEADMPLVHHFQVASTLTEEPITIDVFYEWKPSRCDSCKVFGHSCRPQKGKDIENVEVENQQPEVKGSDMGTHNQAERTKDVHHQKSTHEEGPRIDTTKENKGKENANTSVLPVSSKNGEHTPSESMPTQHKGVEAAAPVILKRGVLQEETHICTMNKMVSLSSEIKGKGKEADCEPTGSSSEGQGSHNSQIAITSPSPKQKKKKKGGKKRQGGHSPSINNVEGSSNCRILVGWNTLRVHLQCIHVSAQWITCDIRQLSSAYATRITFVYGSNNYNERTSLWQYLGSESLINASTPWSILGDFNAVLRPNDRSGGSTAWLNHHNDFPNCIMEASLQQIPYSGIRFSWHNGQSGEGNYHEEIGIWIFGNQSLLVQWLAVRGCVFA
ncbi:hypothetical protein OIU84_020271 [Salix udensis]|uniref:DUF4283 domain-containing protein n=1 Tax=Salix udensis TaxID=889485 RepID=A0AAD6NPQ1_9ROSI|nr:hypothetical protein OIU84_020271 [Salix udensis]